MEKFQWEDENLCVWWRKEIKIVAEQNKNPIQGNEVVVGSATGLPAAGRESVTSRCAQLALLVSHYATAHPCRY